MPATSHPGTVTSDGSNGGAIGWANPTNAEALDSVYATATTATSGTTQYLNAQTFGFAIDSAATIVGISVNVNKTRAGPASDVSARIIKGGTVQSTQDKAISGQWPTGASTYGAPTDLWGLTWTPSDINSSGFGFAISASIGPSGDATTAYVDYISITVYYTTPIPPPTSALTHARTTVMTSEVAAPARIYRAAAYTTAPAWNSGYYDSVAFDPGNNCVLSGGQYTYKVPATGFYTVSVAFAVNTAGRSIAGFGISDINGGYDNEILRGTDQVSNQIAGTNVSGTPRLEAGMYVTGAIWTSVAMSLWTGNPLFYLCIARVA